jgi:hypothetical protein
VTPEFRRRTVLIAASKYGAACKRLEVHLNRVPSIHSDMWTEEERNTFDAILADIERTKQTLLLIASKYDEPCGTEISVPHGTNSCVKRA